MPAFNFQKQFVASITEGTKTGTIRKERKDKRCPADKGDTLTLYTGMRTKHCALIAEVECISVKSFMIHQGLNKQITCYKDGRPIKNQELETLAIADGFKNSTELVAFFRKTAGLPFIGWHIEWEGKA